jgi:hypothetical protein
MRSKFLSVLLLASLFLAPSSAQESSSDSKLPDPSKLSSPQRQHLVLQILSLSIQASEESQAESGALKIKSDRLTLDLEAQRARAEKLGADLAISRQEVLKTQNAFDIYKESSKKNLESRDETISNQAQALTDKDSELKIWKTVGIVGISASAALLLLEILLRSIKT